MVLLLFGVLLICRWSGYMMLVSRKVFKLCIIVCVYVCVCVCVWLQSDLSRVVQSALFVSAINTLLQTVLGSRLPAVMGNSFYFLSITLSIVNAPSIINIPDSHEVSKPHSPSLSLSPSLSPPHHLHQRSASPSTARLLWPWQKNAQLSEPQKSLINTLSNRIPVYTTSSNFSLLLVCRCRDFVMQWGRHKEPS